MLECWWCGKPVNTTKRRTYCSSLCHEAVIKRDEVRRERLSFTQVVYTPELVIERHLKLINRPDAPKITRTFIV